MAVATGNVERELDRVIDSEVDFHFVSTAHYFTHIFQVIKGKQGFCFNAIDKADFILPEFSPDMVRISLGRHEKNLLCRINAKCYLI